MIKVEKFEVVMKRMLDRIPSSFDKREGSVIWLALVPSAAEIVQLQIDSVARLNESFADTASYPYLRRRAKERGKYPFEATNAILKGEFSQNIPLGSRFGKDNLTYTAIEKLEDGFEYKLMCEQKGIQGNDYFGTIIPLQYIDGLEIAEITEILIPARDLENVEDFRKRYEDSFKSEAFGGNIQDYKEKTLTIDGVGAVRVIPIWQGGGTVKEIILDGELNKPSELLIETVQNELDPAGYSGLGHGLAPIGHVVTIVGADEVLVNINTTVALGSGISWGSIKPQIKDSINDYLLELKKDWQDNDIVVRLSQVEARILNIDGVIDIVGTTLNGNSENITLNINEIPKLGDVTNG